MSGGGVYKGPKWDSLGRLMDLLVALDITNYGDLRRKSFMSYMDRRSR